MKGTIFKVLLGLFLGVVTLHSAYCQLPSRQLTPSLKDQWDRYVSNIISNADKDNHLAMCYTDTLQELAMLMPDSIYLTKAHRFKGQILRRLDKPNEAICELQLAAQISKRHNFTTEYGYALNGMAVAYNYIANYEMALSLNFELLEFREKEGDCEEIATTLQNIGTVYLHLSNEEKALEYFNKVLVFPSEFYKKELVFINMGLCYLDLKDYVNGQKFLEEGLRYCGDKCGSLITIPGYYGLGRLYMFLNRYDLSESHFNRSYSLAKEMDDKRYQLENLIGLADLKVNQNRFEEGSRLLEAAMSLISQTHYQESRLKIYRAFADLFLKRKELERASIYQSKYIGLKESIHSLRMARKLVDVQAKMEAGRNLSTISYQREILELKEETIRTHQMINWLAGILGLLLMIMAALLYRSNLRKMEINRLLDQKVKERTNALGSSHINLKRSQQVKNSVMDKAYNDLNSSIASLEGLCNVASRDPEIPETFKGYLNGMVLVSNRLRKVLGKFKSTEMFDS